MDGFKADMTQVRALAADLGGAGKRLRPAMKATVTRAALNIKNTAKASIIDQSVHSIGHRYLPEYPYSITYDIHTPGYVVTAEIGPDKNKSQGPLGWILEYGTPRDPPFPHLNPALDAEEDPAVEWLAKAAHDSIFGV